MKVKWKNIASANSYIIIINAPNMILNLIGLFRF